MASWSYFLLRYTFLPGLFPSHFLNQENHYLLHFIGWNNHVSLCIFLFLPFFKSRFSLRVWQFIMRYKWKRQMKCGSNTSSRRSIREPLHHSGLYNKMLGVLPWYLTHTHRHTRRHHVTCSRRWSAEDRLRNQHRSGSADTSLSLSRQKLGNSFSSDGCCNLQSFIGINWQQFHHQCSIC